MFGPTVRLQHCTDQTLPAFNEKTKSGQKEKKMESHYGNLVVYMRLKNIVPPTSEQGFLPQSKKQ